ncbi:transcription factor IIIA [Xenopus laevis]|nr:transcription factor IIIA [Xenopus laevis]AAA49967.1 5S RNA gene transcription factor (putative); putative [Xenopus laevis]
MGEKALPVVYKRYICSFADCGAAYNKNWKLQAHLCKHTGEKPFPCKEEGCEKGFTSLHHLTRHSLTHTGEKNFTCDSDGCDLRFTTKANMKKHFNRFHNIKICVYVCHFENCGKAFKKHNQLKVHQFSHTQQLPYECPHEGCDKRFSLPSRLKRHEKVHAGYPCKKDDSCSFVGKTWTLYLKHVAECHQDLAVCDVCNRKFRHKDYLRDHQKTHEKERTVYLCPRDGCDRSYTTAFNLRSHIQSFHEEQRPFVCEHAGCGKCFAMKKSLERHSVVHDPEKRKLKEKCPRPKRSLASRLTGYIPPKSKEKNASVSGTEKTDSLVKNKPSGTETNGSLVLDKLTIQ